MRTDLLESVAHVITACCYWIRVADISEHHPYRILRDGHLYPVTSRHLTLEVTHSRGHYWVGHRWQVAEPELDRVLADMLCDTPGLHRRCHCRSLSPSDVETLIKRASYGVISLDMLEDDFTPTINR